MQRLLEQVRQRAKVSKSTGEIAQGGTVTHLYANAEPPVCCCSTGSQSAQQVQHEMQQFFQKHSKTATLLKERGSANNVPAAVGQAAATSPSKEGIHPAATLSKQQKKKRRQQKKTTEAVSSRSQSPIRDSVEPDSPLSADRPAQLPLAQDHSTPAEPYSAPAQPVDTVTAAPSVLPSATAEPEAEPAVETDQDRAEAAKIEGNAEYKAGHYEAALAAYGRAISICPEVAAYYGNRAAAALMKRDYKLAVQDSLHATKLTPSFARGYQRAGECCIMACLEQLS